MCRNQQHDEWYNAGESPRPFQMQNMRAYLTVLLVWLISASVIASIALRIFDTKPTAIKLWLLALVSVMVGMAIMFVASLLNLMKMKDGLIRLAQGETNPHIPPVWCPVLTSATHAVISCARRLRETTKTNKGVDKSNKNEQ